ncbi:Ff.00g107690.m01.CDS01 [Fusarium sp. VM40]|nr:Ff.00g107690.m01.CDS01 [Fusarium sp. VM40]
MSTQRPNDQQSITDIFQLWLVKMRERGYPPNGLDPAMQAALKRIETTFSDVKKNMSANLANELAALTIKKMGGMALSLVRDITRCPAYQVLKDASASGLSITFPDWFFFATVYGPNHTAIQPFHD